MHRCGNSENGLPVISFEKGLYHLDSEKNYIMIRTICASVANKKGLPQMHDICRINKTHVLFIEKIDNNLISEISTK